MRLFKEALFVGFMTVFIGSIVGYAVGKMNNIDLPDVCKKWNKNHIMEVSLFLTGFIIHITCEYSGLNTWYCKNGNACMQ